MLLSPKQNPKNKHLNINPHFSLIVKDARTEFGTNYVGDKNHKIEKHPTQKWEISIIEIENHIGKKYKVTRRLPEMSVAETKVFRSKEEAKEQFDEWLK